MPSYKFARRAFLQSVGGAVGLDILLRSFEGMAEGATPPPRLLVAYWPLGTIQPDFVPPAGTSWTQMPILRPIAAAGLDTDTSVFLGFSSAQLNPGGAGIGASFVFMTTGTDVVGTRAGQITNDDACAGGPSFDQIFLRDSPALARPGIGYANAICDSRVDFLGTSTRCLSYAYDQRPVATAYRGTQTENVPLLPTLSPLAQYLKLFAGLMPGGSTSGNQD